MSLLPDVQSLLSTAGYRILQNPSVPFSVAFEDASLFGFVVEYPSIGALREGWKNSEELFLTVHAPSLRRAAQKAWNCYSIHITADVGTVADLRSLLSIEESFRSTRKIARAALSSRKDLVHVLAPLLPLQNVLPQELQLSTTDLPGRLREWPPNALAALLADEQTDDIVSLLLASQ